MQLYHLYVLTKQYSVTGELYLYFMYLLYLHPMRKNKILFQGKHLPCTFHCKQGKNIGLLHKRASGKSIHFGTTAETPGKCASDSEQEGR